MKLSSFIFYMCALIILMILVKFCQFNTLSMLPKGTHIHNQIHYDLYMSDKFDRHEIDLINQATLEWENKTNNLLVYHIKYNVDVRHLPPIHYKNHSIIFVKLSKYSSLTHQIDLEHNKSKILGLYDGVSNIPRIFLMYDRMLGDEYYRGVVEHELGHSLGLEHDPLRNTLMYAAMDHSSRYVSHEDLIQFCKKYHCNANQLK